MSKVGTVCASFITSKTFFFRSSLFGLSGYWFKFYSEAVYSEYIVINRSTSLQNFICCLGVCQQPYPHSSPSSTNLLTFCHFHFCWLFKKCLFRIKCLLVDMKLMYMLSNFSSLFFFSSSECVKSLLLHVNPAVCFFSVFSLWPS